MLKFSRHGLLRAALISLFCLYSITASTAVEELCCEDDAVAEELKPAMDEELERHRMERLSRALPDLHKAMTGGEWDYKDGLSRFQITFRSSGKEWDTDVHASIRQQDPLETAVDELRSILLEWDIPMDAVVRLPASAIEEHALDVESKLNTIEQYKEIMVSKMKKFVPNEAVEFYLECMEKTKSRTLTKSWHDRTNFLDGMVDDIKEKDDIMEIIQTFDSNSRHLMYKFGVHASSLWDDSTLCFDDVLETYADDE